MVDDSKYSILIVDDEQDMLYIIKSFLTSDNYDLFTAGSGLECIEKNEKLNPDLIILDLAMPGMNGIETLRSIRKTDSDVLVLILTGYGSAETIRDAAELNVYEYISKPVDGALLTEVVEEALSDRGKDHDGQ